MDGARPGEAPPFEIEPARGAAAAPVVFASPHSGALRPADMRPAAGLDDAAFGRAEDRFVDALIAPAAAAGFTLIRARYSRAYVDLNRAADEIDGDMIEGCGGPLPRRRTAKVAAGLGVLPRVCADGRPVYDRALGPDEVEARLARVHRPYHAAVSSLLADAKARAAQSELGGALLIDWHSMPSAAAEGEAVDLVIGDRFGAACSPAVTVWLESVLTAEGFRVRRNAPYAGGYALEAHGRPGHGVHAAQIEINRALYLNEDTLERGPGYTAFAARLQGVFARMAGADWPLLLQRA